MTWHQRSFGNLEVGDIVEFYENGVDPNAVTGAAPRNDGPMEIKSAPEVPGGFNGSPTGLMVRAGKGSFRVRSDEYSAWIREGGYSRDGLS